MTVLNLTAIPNDIATVEELATWCAMVLRETAPNQLLVEAVNISNYQCDINQAVSPDGKNIIVLRFLFEQKPPSAVVGKPWNATMQIARSAEIPSYYLSN